MLTVKATSPWLSRLLSHFPVLSSTKTTVIELNQKISDLIYKYQSYFETIHPKDNDVNILLCYDALIKTLYDYSENLQKFDIVISSNNYNEKEQLYQKGTTLFFLADQMNKESKIFTKKQPSINGIDVLNCEYHNTRSLIRKR